MNDQIILIAKYSFLLLVYAFLSFALWVIYSQLKPSDGKSVKTKKKGRSKAPFIDFTESGGSGRYSLRTGELVIGRGEACDVTLEDTYVSKSHSRIFVSGDRYFLEDLGSVNGTYLNGTKINYPAELRDGDMIKIGTTAAEFFIP